LFQNLVKRKLEQEEQKESEHPHKKQRQNERSDDSHEKVRLLCFFVSLLFALASI
jgi:hypothetical protein